ncbi:cytochrome c [Luteimonas sp. 50]|uniref:Cytochrome c n=1 Tax=Cognatiluteimonas sedimenti TaxID=2927791 RepID=A0ABT0A0Y9_9GAMM|nr:cytochrome c [Lysobacter sedimenti]MCJ0824635.1 cytochrome c [Lysobacter sedimenti]
MNTSAAKAGNAAARYFFLFLIGLAVGIVATVMALRALDARKDHYPESVMHVMDAHAGALKANIEQSRCAATDTLPHLQALRTMANDIEPAFGDLREDARFAKHVSDLRASLDGTLSSPPLNCAGVDAALKDIGGNCKACHQDFRN